MSLTEPKIYATGNAWQKKVYKKMSNYLGNNPEIIDFGQSRNGQKYKHLLTKEQSKFNFINEELFKATKERFQKHKAGDLNRIRLKIYGPKCRIFEQEYILEADLNTKISLVYGETEYTHYTQMSKMLDKLKIVFEIGEE